MLLDFREHDHCASTTLPVAQWSALSYPMDSEQMPARAGCKVIEQPDDATEKAFVQSNFSVNKWSASSYLAQRLAGVAEAAWADVGLVHHGEVEPAHLAVGLVAVVEDAASLNAAAAPADEDHGELRGVVLAGAHAR